MFSENELRGFENFRSGFQIFRLGVLIEKWQLAVPARVLLYEKRSFISELFSSEVSLAGDRNNSE